MSYVEMIKHAETFLGERGPGASLPAREIAEHLEGLMATGQIDTHPRGVINVSLSRAANHDENSRIVSGGPGGGYRLEALVQEEPEPAGEDQGSDFDEMSQAEPETVENRGNAQVKIREKHLYPLMQVWLKANDYMAADVSTLKAGGQWGNPDLLGVTRVEILGASELELVSVEVKLADLNWERFIFEAISHKRFVNRSWFCFRTATAYPPLPKKMADYAERYKIGIIQIYLTDAELQGLANGTTASDEFLDRVQERVRGLYEPVPLQEKKAFLDRAGILLGLNVASAKTKV